MSLSRLSKGTTHLISRACTRTPLSLYYRRSVLDTVSSSHSSAAGGTFGHEYRGFVSSKHGCYKWRRNYDLCNSCSMLSARHYAKNTTRSSEEKKSNKMLIYLTGLVFAMVGASYAAVPLYRRFFQATGYGGTVQRKESVEEKIARHSKDGTVTSREIMVQFNADVADGIPWNFIPTQREVLVKPGETALVF